MYVINYVQGGFIIISATKEYFPILAYSDENQFELNPKNGGATDWVNQTQYAINHSNELPDSIQSKIFAIWQHYDPQPQTTEGSVSKGSTEENTAIYDRISAMRSAYPGYSFRPLSGCSSSTFPVNSGIYETLCNYANECNSPYEYTIVAIKDIIATSTTGHLLTTKWDQGATFNNLCPYYYYSTHMGPSANNPLYTESVGNTFLSMNWGWGGSNDGWFGPNQVNPSGGNGYNNNRINLYISKK